MLTFISQFFEVSTTVNNFSKPLGKCTCFCTTFQAPVVHCSALLSLLFLLRVKRLQSKVRLIDGTTKIICGKCNLYLRKHSIQAFSWFSKFLWFLFLLLQTLFFTTGTLPCLIYAILRNFRWIRLKPDWLEFSMFEFYVLYAWFIQDVFPRRKKNSFSISLYKRNGFCLFETGDMLNIMLNVFGVWTLVRFLLISN